MLKCKSGHALLKLDQAKTSDGSIVLPEIIQGKRGRIGTVKLLSLWDGGRSYQIWDGGRLKTIEAAAYNENYANLTGKRVFAEVGRLFNYEGEALFLVRLEHIIAVLPDAGRVEGDIDINRVPRCPRCRSKTGELNMLLDGQGYCIQCGCTPEGKRRSGRLDWRGLPEDDYALTQKDVDAMREVEQSARN